MSMFPTESSPWQMDHSPSAGETHEPLEDLSMFPTGSSPWQMDHSPSSGETHEPLEDLSMFPTGSSPWQMDYSPSSGETHEPLEDGEFLCPPALTIEEALRDRVGLPVRDFALIALLDNGDVQTSTSASLGQYQSMIFPDHLKAEFRQGIGEAINSQYDTPLLYPVGHIQNLDISKKEDVKACYVIWFQQIQTPLCTVIREAFIKFLEPNEQNVYEYAKNVANAPPWWPRVSSSRRNRTLRIHLLVDILRFAIKPYDEDDETFRIWYKDDKCHRWDINVEKLEEVTMEVVDDWLFSSGNESRARFQEKRQLLTEIFRIAKLEEAYENAKIHEDIKDTCEWFTDSIVSQPTMQDPMQRSSWPPVYSGPQGMYGWPTNDTGLQDMYGGPTNDTGLDSMLGWQNTTNDTLPRYVVPSQTLVRQVSPRFDDLPEPQYSIAGSPSYQSPVTPPRLHQPEAMPPPHPWNLPIPMN